MPVKKRNRNSGAPVGRPPRQGEYRRTCLTISRGADVAAGILLKDGDFANRSALICFLLVREAKATVEANGSQSSHSELYGQDPVLRSRTQYTYKNGNSR